MANSDGFSYDELRNILDNKGPDPAGEYYRGFFPESNVSETSADRSRILSRLENDYSLGGISFIVDEFDHPGEPGVPPRYQDKFIDFSIMATLRNVDLFNRIDEIPIVEPVRP